MSLRQTLLAFSFAAISCSTVPALSQEGTCTTVVLSPYSSYVEGINDAGAVAGWFQNQTNGIDGFIMLPDGTETIVDYPGYVGGTLLFSINDAGQAAGTAGPNVFIYNISAQTFSKVNLHGVGNSGRVAINNAGSVAGSTVRNGTSYGYLVSGSQFRLLLPPGATGATTFSISREGRVFGQATLADGSIAPYSYFNGKYSPLKISVPGLVGISPLGMSAVGNTTNSLGFDVGFLQQAGKSGYEFQCEGSDSETVALAVNDSGQAAGFYGLVGAPFTSGFIWTPTARKK